jgi:3-deoxy-D-manno-octulosonic-acid transferase
MNVSPRLYTALLRLLTPLALLRLLWRARKQPDYLKHIGERFGRYSIEPRGPLIWLHAVSVGETRAAEPLVQALRARHPDCSILLTHMTPTGRQTSEQLFKNTVLRCYLPYDLPFAVSRFIARFRPRLGVLMETELWPNLIEHCRRSDVPLVLVNARLSERSARGYAQISRLASRALRGLTAIGAQSETDAVRLRALGAARVTVTGNLKFDRGPSSQDLALGAALRDRFGRRRSVLVAASTREGEEELILDAIAGLPATLLCVIVPRHPQRFADVAALLARRSIAFQRRSEAESVRDEVPVVLGDSMGEMFAYYAASDMAFVGGSLLPLGGQNLLEACAAGKPVLVGPHMFNFAEATQLALAAGAAIQVPNVSELSAAVQELLADDTRRKRMGAAGIELMQQHRGATQRTLELLDKVLQA